MVPEARAAFASSTWVSLLAAKEDRYADNDRPASYPGYADTTISVNPLTAYYGDNVCKLIDIKKKYDPNDVFTNPLAIPTSVPDGFKC